MQLFYTGVSYLLYGNSDVHPLLHNIGVEYLSNEPRKIAILNNLGHSIQPIVQGVDARHMG